MDETERMVIVAQELMLSHDELRALLCFVEDGGEDPAPAELIAALSGGESLVVPAVQPPPAGRQSRLRHQRTNRLCHPSGT